MMPAPEFVAAGQSRNGVATDSPGQTVADARLWTWRSVGSALSLANLYMVGVWDEIEDDSFDYFRQVPYQTWATLGRSLLYLILLALVFWGFMALVERARRPFSRKAGCVLLLALVAVALDTARVHALHFYGEGLERFLGAHGLKLLAAILGCGLLYAIFRHDRAVVSTVRAVLVFLVALVPINVATAAWAVHSTWPASMYARVPSAPLLQSRQTTPKFVWIVFDEWDRYLSFDKRAQSLALPEVDRFRAESLWGEQVLPPAPDTMESLPSLITGRIVRKSRWTTPNNLSLNFGGAETSVPWAEHPNVFRRAREIGVNSVMVGFYHPYQRVLGGDLSESFSTSHLALYNDEIYWQDVHGLQRARLMAEESLRRLPLIERSGILGDRRRKRVYGIAYSMTFAKTLHFLETSPAELLFFHLPVPHPPAFFDRVSGKLTAEKHGSYDDNLALMDITFGNIRRVMERRGDWDKSFVLITSDHPLRGKEASKRPWIPFLLKAPGQTRSLSYAEPFNSVLTQELVLAALGGKLRTAEEVAAWLNQNRLRFPVGSPPAEARASQQTGGVVGDLRRNQ